MSKETTISNLLLDLKPDSTALFLQEVFDKHGFNLSKADYDALLMHLLRQSESFYAKDSFERAEFLGMPISRYRSINRRSAMWQKSDSEAEQEIILHYFERIIKRFSLATEANDIIGIQVVVDDEVDKLILEKFFLNHEIPLSYSGNSISLQKSDAQLLLDRFKKNKNIPKKIRDKISTAKINESYKLIFNWFNKAGPDIVKTVIETAIYNAPSLLTIL